MPHPRFGAGFLFRKRQAPVAQLDRALDYESRGQEFESLRARHFFLPQAESQTTEGDRPRRGP